MALSILQIMFGIGFGILGFLLLRPRKITYDNQRSHPESENALKTESDNSYKWQLGDKCVICLEETTAQNKQDLKCGHNFHKYCYEKCLEITNKCPMCSE